MCVCVCVCARVCVISAISASDGLPDDLAIAARKTKTLRGPNVAGPCSIWAASIGCHGETRLAARLGPACAASVLRLCCTAACECGATPCGLRSGELEPTLVHPHPRPTACCAVSNAASTFPTTSGPARLALAAMRCRSPSSFVENSSSVAGLQRTRWSRDLVLRGRHHMWPLTRSKTSRRPHPSRTGANAQGG